MKKFKILVATVVVLCACFAFAGCGKDEQSLLYQFKETGKTSDAIPLKYVTVSMYVTDSKTDVEFKASDFSISRNGVKEVGVAFITGFEYHEVNGEKTFVSFTETVFTIKKDGGADLKIVFGDNENITELFYKNNKIKLA